MRECEGEGARVRQQGKNLASRSLALVIEARDREWSQRNTIENRKMIFSSSLEREERFRFVSLIVFKI